MGMVAMMNMAVAQMRANMQMTPCPGCTRPTPASSLTPMSARRPPALPPRALCNSYERGVLVDFLQGKGIGARHARVGSTTHARPPPPRRRAPLCPC
jgi:hypothetical protein